MKEFRLIVKDPTVEIYDSNFNAVMPAGDGKYLLRSYYSEKLGVYVTRPHYALKITYEPFSVSVDKFVCTSEGVQYAYGSLFCINGMVKVRTGALIYGRDVFEFLREVVRI